MVASSRFSEDEQKRQQRMGIPRKVREDIGREDFDPERPAPSEACRFAAENDPRPFLVMLGGVGCGKSNAAAYAVSTADRGGKTVSVLIAGQAQDVRLSSRPPTGAWVHAFEVVKASTYDGEFWRKVQNPELLVIDDLGTMPLDGKGYAASNLANLLCYREAQDFKTILTANLTWAEFEADYLTGPGERVRDRMKRYDGMVFQVPGPSLRRVAP